LAVKLEYLVGLRMYYPRASHLYVDHIVLPEVAGHSFTQHPCIATADTTTTMYHTSICSSG